MDSNEELSDAPISSEYQRVLHAPSDAEALDIEAQLLKETKKRPEDPSESLDPGVVASMAEGESQVDRLLARALSEINYREGPRKNQSKYGRWYRKDFEFEPWCAMFVSWAFWIEGLALPATTGKGFARTELGAEWFRKNRLWSLSPKPGHIVFYDFSHAQPNSDHVGIVVEVLVNGYIKAVEGNTPAPDGGRDGVFLKRRRDGIVGYGVPPYKDDNGVPRWAGRVLRQPPPMYGGDVSQWQRRMAQRGWRQMVIDGEYSALDEQICRAFQREKALWPTGQVDEGTWRATWKAPITSD